MKRAINSGSISPDDSKRARVEPGTSTTNDPSRHDFAEDCFPLPVPAVNLGRQSTWEDVPRVGPVPLLSIRHMPALLLPLPPPPPPPPVPDNFYQLECKMVMDFQIGCNLCTKDNFSKEIWAFFCNNQQPSGMYKQKIDLWRELDKVLKFTMPCWTHPFGSTLNGFGSNKSDLDLCLFMDSNMSTDRQKVKNDVELLARVRKIFRSKCSKFLSPNMELIPAKVPILKIYDNFGKLEIDLSCNNDLSVKNTHLLFCYSMIDWRVKPLALILKEWADRAKIKDAKTQTLSSYTLTLMVIHFLQCGVQPPILPSLQVLYPEVFERSMQEISFFEPLPPFLSKNEARLGTLVRQFFNYYNNTFDFTRDAGSVRLGKTLPISECQKYARDNYIGPGQWDAYICMEEPFERTNAGRAVCKRDRFDVVLSAFKDAGKRMKDVSKLQQLFSN